MISVVLVPLTSENDLPDWIILPVRVVVGLSETSSVVVG